MRNLSGIPKGFRYFMKPDKKKQPWLTRLKKLMKRRVPITSWITSYTKDDIFGDIIAGITIALTITPQSIAYAALAGVDPQVRFNEF